MTENKILEIKEKIIQKQFFNYKKEEITKDMKINLEELFKNEYFLFLKERENFNKGYSTTMVNGSTFEVFLKNKLKNKSKEFKNSCNLKTFKLIKTFKLLSIQ